MLPLMLQAPGDAASRGAIVDGCSLSARCSARQSHAAWRRHLGCISANQELGRSRPSRRGRWHHRPACNCRHSGRTDPMTQTCTGSVARRRERHREQRRTWRHIDTGSRWRRRTAVRCIDTIEANALAMDLDRVAVDHRCDPSNCYRSRLDYVLQIDLRQRSAVMHDKLRHQNGNRSHRHEDEAHRHAGPAAYERASCASTLPPRA